MDTTNNADVLIGARRNNNANGGTAFTLDSGVQLWDSRIHNVAFTAAEMFHAWNPATRWDLYREEGLRAAFFVPAVVASAAAKPPSGLALLGVGT